MCRRVFLGSAAPLPLVALADGRGEFEVRPVPDDRGVRERLGVAHLVEAVTEQHCSCDFNVPNNEMLVETFPDDAEEQADLARAQARALRLHAYVEDAARRAPVSAYVCWWDEERHPTQGNLDVDVSWFLRPALDDVDRRVLRVRESMR